jgi:hypothetical protein
MSNKEDQDLEIEALQSIFNEDELSSLIIFLKIFKFNF